MQLRFGFFAPFVRSAGRIAPVGMVEQDGVYRSEQRRVQRRKKIGVGLAGLAAILAGGGYAVSALRSAQQSRIAGDTAAVAPVTSSASASASVSPSGSARPPSTASVVPAPVSRSPSPRLSAARRSSRPTPTPTPSASPTPVPDADVAAAQVSRLLTAPRTTPSGNGVSAAGGTVVVANESGPDGSAVRVLSARYDLTVGGSLLEAADAGVPVGAARCTRNLRVAGVRETRPGVLLCWRASPDKSVVTVATRAGGGPVAATSARIIDRVWQRLG